MINGAALATLTRQKGVQVFFLPLSQIQPETDNANHREKEIPEEFQEFKDVFSKVKADKLPEHRPYDHRIPLEEGKCPLYGPIYNLSQTELEALRKYIDDNLTKRFIRHSQSPCGASILFAKKADSSLRLWVDYRGLNKLTIKNQYPLPLISEIMERIGRAKYFTKFDVKDGYNRLRIAPGEEWKTAFHCGYGHFEYHIMPFELCNAPGTFQHYINDTYFLIAYLDDLLIYSNSLKEHKRHVRLVLERLRSAGLYLNLTKCVFCVEEVSFLGFVVNKEGIQMDPAKVEAITSWPCPDSVRDIRVFLGLANFYRRFIKNFSKIARPLTELIKKN